MLIMVWNEKFNIGIKEIDEQHKRIFKILKQLRESIKLSRSHSMIITLLDELMINSDIIFKFEEKFMSTGKFYNLEPHRLEHLVFISRVRDFKINLVHQDFISALQSLDFLIHWFTFHILESDKEFAIQTIK